MNSRLNDRVLKETLDTWLGVCMFCSATDTTEQQLEQLLEHEKKNRKRGSVLLRIHSRFNAMRAKRERAELLKIAAL